MNPTSRLDLILFKIIRLFRWSVIIGSVFISLGLAKPIAASTIAVPAGGDLQGAINAAQCGDNIVLQAVASWDGGFTLPNKNCSAATGIKISSSGAASLPNGRVGPADAVNMARIRAMSGAAFVSAVNAGWWTLDGLELTDNAGHGVITQLIDAGGNAGAHDLTIQRCYFHQKESGTNYNRSIMRGVQFEGNGLTLKWNYIYLIGYYYQEVSGSTNFQMDTTGLLSVGGSRITLEDNYISTWWNQLFLGGADTAPQNTANLSGATTNSATFSNTTGLTPGMVVRFEIGVTGNFNSTGITSTCPGQGGVWPGQGSGTLSTATLTRSSGPALSAGDIRRIGLATNGANNSAGLLGLCAVSGDTYTVASVKTQLPATGTVSFKLYETAIVTSVSGNTVSYTPYGANSLQNMGAQTASWNYGDQGLISDVAVRKNTFYVDPAFAHDVYVKKGYSPKGLYEVKNVNRFTFEGNQVLGYPAILAVYPTNQYGTAPWITAKDITIRNNWISPDLGYPESTREAMSIFNQDDYATISPLKNVSIYNNLFKGGITSLAGTKQVDQVSIYHNTVLNIAPTGFSYYDVLHGSEQMTNFVFRDNIVAYQAYGMNCFLGTIGNCWSGTFSNNVVVNSSSSPEAVLGVWGTNSMLGPSPFPTSFSLVGFTDQSSDNYRLSSSSLYKGRATDGTDPGINQDSLLAALSGALPSPTPTPMPTSTPTPTPTATPTGNATATFVGLDTTTAGNWSSNYGADGYNVINDTTNYPSYAVVSPTGQQNVIWTSSTSLAPGLLKASNFSDRIAACWYQSPSYSIDINITDGQTHQMALYALDWDAMGRTETVDIVEASTNALLDSRSISSFSGGKYLVWNVKGHIKINVNNVAGLNAVVSGLFFGGPMSSPTPTPTPIPTPTPTPTPLTASIISPTTNATYSLGSSVTITANASDTAGNVTNLTFQANSQTIGSDTASPYTITWSNMAAGTYTVTATAQDDAGLIVTSAPITVKISKTVKRVRGVKSSTQTLSSAISSTQSNSISSTQSNEISSTQPSLAQDSVQTSALTTLVADLDQTYRDFLDEKAMFPAATVIEKYLFAASFLARTSLSLSAQQTPASALTDRLKKIDSYLSFCEDLMVDGVISSDTVSTANKVNAQVNLSIYQPETTPVGSLGFNVMPNGTARITSVASHPFSTQTTTATGGGSFELADVGVTFGGEATKVLSVSPTELTVVVPADLSGGIAEVVVSSREGFILRGAANVSGLNPRLFAPTDSFSGSGIVLDTFSQCSGPFSATPSIWIGLDARTRLSIMATGLSSGLSNGDVSNDVWLSNGQLLENLSENVSVSATLADGRVFWLKVEYAGAQGQLPGIDQINVVLPPQLAGAGPTDLTVVAGGRVSNTVTIALN